MATPHLASIKSRLENLIALARLLERVERSPGNVPADQYLALVRQLQVALAQELPDDTLHAVLDAYPAAGVVYENLHYQQSGLSLSALERSVESELLAQRALAHAARPA
jgi:hypothetical protein